MAARRRLGDRWPSGASTRRSWVGEQELDALTAAWERVRSGPELRAGDDRRISGRRKVAPRGGVPGRRRCDVRSRPLPLVRRGHHVLAGGGGAEAARATRSRTRARPDRRAEALGVVLGERRNVIHRRDRVGVPQAARGSCGRRSRWSSSSTTSSGARTSSSISSSTSPTCRPVCRSCCCAWRGRSCSTAGAAGAGVTAAASRSRLRRQRR